MNTKGTWQRRVSVGGLCLATIYALVVIVVFVLTAVSTKPSNVGLGWIPFTLLSMPWYAINHSLLLPGLLLNTSIMYLLGTMLQALWENAVKQ